MKDVLDVGKFVFYIGLMFCLLYLKDVLDVLVMFCLLYLKDVLDVLENLYFMLV